MRSWFHKEKQALPVMASCPNKCRVQQPNGVKAVEQEEVGVVPSVARAARLEPGAKLLFCQSCGCVWRRVFDPETVRLHNEVLGTYNQGWATRRLNPESWLQQAIEPAIGPA